MLSVHNPLEDQIEWAKPKNRTRGSTVSVFLATPNTVGINCTPFFQL